MDNLFLVRIYWQLNQNISKHKLMKVMV